MSSTRNKLGGITMTGESIEVHLEMLLKNWLLSPVIIRIFLLLVCMLYAIPILTILWQPFASWLLITACSHI